MSLFPYLMPPATHGDDALCAVRADGHRIEFANGHTALDGNSGLWNANLGYNNPRIAAAISEAAHHASYLGAFRYENRYAREAADRLTAVAGPDHYSRVLFASSGGAANDAALKVARHYHVLCGRPRTNIVALRGSYHGLTFGGFALTGEDLGQRMFGVDTRLVRHVTANSISELRLLMERSGDQIAAIVLEPVLGSGTVPLTDEFLAEVLRFRRETGMLIIADEVATGFGRTGPMFASHEWPEQPDILITSKGLTNGTLPASALVLARTVADAFVEQDAMIVHAETQGGSSIPAAAITATIHELNRLDALTNARQVSSLLHDAMTELVHGHHHVTGSEGRGLFRTLHIVNDDGNPLNGPRVADLVARIREAGAIVHPGPGGIQLVPSLTYTPSEVDELIACIASALR
ncbi:daptide-type RiPP biosynthesis aminotransferase [Streptomyces tubercidicus]